MPVIEPGSFIDTSLDGKVEDTGEFLVEAPVAMKTETISRPMNLVPPDPNASGPWVKYNGIATVRILCALDWQNLKIDSNLYCEWNYLNEMKLPKSMFNDEQLDYLLNKDGRFELVEDEKESETTE